MLNRKLEALEKQGKPIRVGIVGCGRMGEGVINQIGQARGMRIVAVADKMRDRAEAAIAGSSATGQKIATVVTDDADEAARAIEQGRVVVSTNGTMLCSLPLDVVVEATGIPESRARVAYDAIMHRKHVVTMNVETDAVIGPMLTHLANNAGVVYTVTHGDEPGVLGSMVEWARAIGLEVVAAVKGCMRPIDWNANSITLADEAENLGLNPKMLASFRDGSKHNVEICVTANGTGLAPDIRGSHAKALAYDEIPSQMRLKKDGGILSRSGVVELAPPVLGPDGKPDLSRSVTPGVYLVVSTSHPQIHTDFKYLLMGEGPTYVLHRPYHLCAMETPWSVAQAAIRGEATMNAVGAPVAEVLAVAKKDLKPGDVITGSGGAEITGQIDTYANCRRENLLPLGLSYDVKIKRDVPKGRPLTLADVQLDEASLIYQLWRLQLSTFPAK